MSNLGDAPIEVLFLILNNIDQQNHLYECTLINKSFYAAANPLLWRAPQMAGGTKREDTILFRLKQSFRLPHQHCLHSTPLGHNVRKLDASKICRLQDLRVVINNVPLVEELVIGIEKLKDKDMERIAIKCPQLKCLCFISPLDGSDRFFDPLRHCTNLRELSIYHSLGSHLQLAPLQHCPLKKLRLYSYGFDNEYAKDTFFVDIPTLTHLDMDYMPQTYYRHFQALPSRPHFPVLTDLRIRNCRFHDNSTMVSFFKSHPLISTLSLKDMQINQAVMTSLATDLIHLKYLCLIDNRRLPALTNPFHRVEKLNIRGCHINAQHMAMYFSNLRYIHVAKGISTRRFNDDISQLDGSTVETITKLTYLDFTSYDSVPDDLKVYLPRRTGGQLVKEDLDHIRETALGLVWIY
ncbi:hypothetical protein [Absidia glauca]|uniref:F-box domain-containing protein n=1 Tax=Absidia glauca TaxID=4829 RepID=A0A168LXW2_ABSGL|nr:hypothetical protein [Absidia glauca]